MYPELAREAGRDAAHPQAALLPQAQQQALHACTKQLRGGSAARMLSMASKAHAPKATWHLRARPRAGWHVCAGAPEATTLAALAAPPAIAAPDAIRTCTPLRWAGEGGKQLDNH